MIIKGRGLLKPTPLLCCAAGKEPAAAPGMLGGLVLGRDHPGPTRADPGSWAALQSPQCR